MTPTPWGPQPALDVLKARRIYHREVAEAVGTTKNVVGFQLRGYSWPAPEFRAALSEFLGLPESELFTEQVLTSPRPKVGPKPRPKAVAS